MSQVTGLDPQELIALIQSNPEVKQALLQTLKAERKRKQPASAPDATGNASDEPDTVPAFDPTTTAQFQRLMLAAIQQIAANSAEQKRTAATIYRSVQTMHALAKEIRGIKRLGRDAKEIGEVAVLAVALTTGSLFVLVLTAIVLKNALLDAIGKMNLFHTQGNPPAAMVNLDFPGIYQGGEVAGVPVTSNFGMRTHPITGEQRMHEGADLSVDSGTPLYAPAAGTVTCGSDPSGYGTFANMSLPNGDSIRLGHLTDCTAGAATVGKQIATSGNSGGSTAPHLHLELHKGGQAVQPTVDVALGILLGVDYLKVRELTARYYGATVSQESGGSAEAQNGRTQAAGLTQIMPDNIPNWSREALGHEISVDDFLSHPGLQKQISLYRMASNVAQQLKETGGDDRQTLRRVAAIWYSGNAARENDYAPLPYASEPSVGDYVDAVMSKIDDKLGTDAVIVPPPSAKEEVERAMQQQTQSSSPAFSTNAIAPSVLCVKITVPAAGKEECGSGVAVAPNQVITNLHMAPTEQSIVVFQGQWLAAKRIKTDPSSDLALLQVDDANFPVAPLAASSQLAAGAAVEAIGYPGGSEQQTTTQGIVEKLNAICADPQDGITVKCIRTAPGLLQPGNSGGALVAQGQVVGINRAVQAGTGAGVSVPIEAIQQFLRQ